MDDDGALTAEERGDARPGIRGPVRVAMVVAVVVLVVGVVLTGNFVHTGTFLPWVDAAAQSDTPLVAPSPSGSAGSDGSDTPKTPAERVAAEDARLSAVAALPTGDPALLDTWNTVVLAPRNGQQTGYLFGDLVALGAVRVDDGTTATLVRNVVIRAGAELDLYPSAAQGTDTLRLLSTADTTTSIVGWGGILAIGGTADHPVTVTSWDDTLAAPDTDQSDGRAYIRVRDGILGLVSTRLSDLGFWSGRTGGVSVTGSGSGSIAALQDVTTTGLHYGFFGSDTTGITITDSRFDDSTLTGVEVTNGASDTTIEKTSITGSGGDGIAVSRQSSAVTLDDVTVEGSAGWGVRVDGAALADGPTTGGYGLTPSQGLTLTECRISGNREGGVRVISTDDTEIRRTTVDETRTAVLVEGPSTGLTVANADLSSADLRGLDISGDITDATVSDSRLVGRRIALELTRAAVIVSGNDMTVASGYAVELADGARADITGNVLRGVGQDAVALWSGARTMQADNDQSAWTFQWAWVGWMNEHPMMWMWALVLLVPAIGVPVLWRRRREHQRLRDLLREALLRHGEEQMAAYPGGVVEAPRPVDEQPAEATAPVLVGSPSSTSTRGAGPRMPQGPGSWTPGERFATSEPVGTPRGGVRPGRVRPRSFADLRTGPLEGRTFASLQDFAVAAVREGGYSVTTIARLFRIQHWRLQQWVDEADRASRETGVSA
ncbi:right-handed parallel beta-helix repeat-containing protein [Microbacterium sp. KSW2-21]|uniref:Right-handed parallel beta-helix repeat-containing protein n=1 Tax=Microbacterium algihabitans TaxID=3075992 RepID=A0ABU3RS35_9MICO|nr:right-handed parallel beta-helix repeat-containing protein [Microbacterium sp. KSW2-21]MDU0325708.1 right-handed parallel beta-helix repeat-containing protein [Microbacterium sp. KSW2-21]